MKKLILSLFIFLASFIGYSQNGAALDFDGTNDYVNLPNVNTPFNISSTHIKTFQLWFKNTNTQGQHVRIFSTGTANWTTGIWFGYALGSPFLRFELSDGIVPSGCAITGTTNIRGDNQWHHATGVINGSVAILYLDAVLEGTVNISSEGAMNSAGSVHIGNSYNNESASYFQGNVDEIRVWDRILCQSEIMTTMNCELTGAETGLVAYYKFNQGIASGNNAGIINLPDLTINANNGSLTNFALTSSISNWVSPGGVTTGFMCAPTATDCLSNGLTEFGVNEDDIKIFSSLNTYEIVSKKLEISEVLVIDITGKLISKNLNLHQGTFKVDLNSISNGLYFINVKLSNNTSKTFKIVNR